MLLVEALVVRDGTAHHLSPMTRMQLMKGGSLTADCEMSASLMEPIFKFQILQPPSGENLVKSAHIPGKISSHGKIARPACDPWNTQILQFVAEQCMEHIFMRIGQLINLAKIF